MVICLGLSKYQTRRRKLVPSSLQNLTATYHIMEHLVTNIYNLAEDQIETVSLVREDQAIKGNLSDSGRLRVKITLASGECMMKHWFVKIMPPNSQPDGEFNVFLNEIAFYRKILPEMKEFIEAEGLGDYIGDFDVPEILYSRADSDGAIIVLEDVIADGYSHERDENGDKFLSVEEMLLAVKSIAKIHAISVALQLQKQVNLNSKHPSLRESGLLWTQADMCARLAIMKDHYCEMLQKSTKLDSPTLLKRFRNTFDSAERLAELCQKRCSTSESVNQILSLQHGDFHFNNLLFKTDCNGNMKVKICDWQLTYTGKQTGDLSYLLMSSLSPQNRELHEEMIKQEYYNAYNSAIQRFQVLDKEVKKSLDQEYQETLPFSFFLTCGNIMALESQDESVKFSYEMCKEAINKQII